MEVWPTRHDSLHRHYHHRTSMSKPISSPPPLPPPSFSLPSQSSPALPIEPLAGYPGILSLHNYRKILSQGTVDGQEGKTLRRKTAASNLNQTTAPTVQMSSFYHNAYYHGIPFSGSSTTSSPPPPLSPSYSPSALSEQLPELVDGLAVPLPPLDAHPYENIMGDKQSSYKLLDTFRDRLEKFSDLDTPDIIEFHGHSRARSDSVLFKTRRARKPPTTATVEHHGTSFEILNPHDSLDFAQIVSYIEDVDSHSAKNHRRDSYLNFPDDSIIGQQDPATWDTLYEYSSADDQKAHDDLVGDSPHHPMPSISERLEERDFESCYAASVRPLSRPLSMVRPWTAHNETDLGEPGPPICCNDDPPALLPPHPTDLDAIHLASLYDIGHLPKAGKGTDNPTAIIYSEHKPLHKKSTVIRKERKALSFSTFSTFSFSPSAAASAPLRRLRGIAQSFRRKTLNRASLS